MAHFFAYSHFEKNPFPSKEDPRGPEIQGPEFYKAGLGSYGHSFIHFLLITHLLCGRF